MRAWLIGAAVALGGCIDASLTLCGDGTACPASLVCDQPHHSCVAPDQLTACDGVSEGGACHTSALAGLCFDGVCLPPGCGNRVVEPGEQCDDGNRAGGDGCSQDCRSDERCGNGVADLALGETCDDGNLVSHDGCDSRCQSETAVWRMFPVSLAGGGTQAAAFDVAHGQLVYPALHTVWLWDGNAWSVSPALPPPVDSWIASTYDSDRAHIVSFALRGGALVVLDWDGTQWIELSTTGTGPDAAVVLVTYDPEMRAILWMSDASFGYLAVSGTSATWSDVTLLPFQLGAAPHAAYDGTRKTVVVVDMQGGGTWEWDRTTWAHVGASPAGSGGHPLVYDVDRGELIAVGGFGVASNNASPDVIAWNGTTWDDTGARIPNRANATVWHDPAHHVIGIYGGLDGQSHALTDLSELAGMTVTPKPFVQPPGLGPLAYDAMQDRLVTIDGGTTYTWDGTWHALGAATPASTSQLVFDPWRGKTLAFDPTNLKVFELATDWQVLIQNGPQASAFTYDYGRRGAVAISTIGAYLLASDAPMLSPIAPAPPDLPLSAAYDLGGSRIAMLGNTGLSDLANGQWQPSLSPSGNYRVVGMLQTRSLSLVPMTAVDDTRPIWERTSTGFRSLGPLPVAGYVRTAVERSRGRLDILLSDGPAQLMAERQLVSSLADETCHSGEDADGDGAAGCEDPDCWATCWPACPLATSCL